ncbi:hypothetical protein JCM8547_000075 [Rhodosporidiobolus lusitaniae]
MNSTLARSFSSDAFNRRSILFRLPTELLQAIFDLAYADWKPRSLLCRSLSRVVVLARWQNVLIKGYGQLVCFCVVSSRDASLLSRIRAISLRGGNKPETKRASNVLSVLHLEPLFGNMVNLEQLTLRVNWIVVERVFSVLEDPANMPCLRSLSVSTSYETWSDPLEPGYWIFLSVRSQLLTLEIDIDHHGSGTRKVAPPRTTLAHVKHIDITAARVIWPAPSPPSMTLCAVFTSAPRLSFYKDVDYSIAELSRLVNGPAAHLCLDRLELSDTDEPCSTGSLVRDYGPFWSVEKSEWTHHPNWRIGGKSATINPEEYEQLMDAADQGGVELVGTLSHGVQVAKAFAEEKRLVKEKWGNAPPPFSPGELAYYTTVRRRW